MICTIILFLHQPELGDDDDFLVLACDGIWYASNAIFLSQCLRMSIHDVLILLTKK
jgi:serine/threonine protein phosphatase PrpC